MFYLQHSYFFFSFAVVFCQNAHPIIWLWHKTHFKLLMTRKPLVIFAARQWKCLWRRNGSTCSLFFLSSFFHDCRYPLWALLYLCVTHLSLHLFPWCGDDVSVIFWTSSEHLLFISWLEEYSKLFNNIALYLSVNQCINITCIICICT